MSKMHFLKLQIQYGGDINEMVLPTNSTDPTVEELQEHLEKQLNMKQNLSNFISLKNNFQTQIGISSCRS